MADVYWDHSGLDRLKRMGASIDPALRRRLVIVGRMLQRDININLQGRVLHKRTGDLLRSWQNRKVSNIPGGYRLAIWSSWPYARIHELGGMAGRGRSVRIPARPYVWTALNRNKARILAELGDALHQVVRRT